MDERLVMVITNMIIGSRELHVKRMIVPLLM